MPKLYSGMGARMGVDPSVRLLVSKNLGLVDMHPKVEMGAGIRHITNT